MDTRYGARVDPLDIHMRARKCSAGSEECACNVRKSSDRVNNNTASFSRMPETGKTIYKTKVIIVIVH